MKTSTINLTPIPLAAAVAGAVLTFGTVWALSKPGEQLFDASMLSVIARWTFALAIILLVYRRRYFLALSLHAGLAACSWTRIFSEADRWRSTYMEPTGLLGQLRWIVSEDMFLPLCVAIVISLSFAGAVLGGARLYRRAREGADHAGAL